MIKKICYVPVGASNMENWEELRTEIDKCATRLAKEELGIAPSEETQLTRKRQIQLLKYWVRCYYRKLATISNKRFDAMLDEILRSINEYSRQSEEKLLKYTLKLGDPRDILRQVGFLKQANKAIFTEFAESVDEKDTRLVGRLFMLSFLNEITLQTYLSSTTPLQDVLALAESTAGLGMDWAVSLIALVLEEAMIRKRLREMGVEPEKNTKFYQLLDTLVKKLEEHNERPTQDILLADGFRDVRDMIAHDPAKWNPKEDEMSDIVRHTLSLMRALQPKPSMAERANADEPRREKRSRELGNHRSSPRKV